jgi:O-antigen ligase
MFNWLLAVLTAVVVALLTTSPVVVTIVMSGCIALALLGPARAVQALTIGTLITYANPAIIKMGPADGILLRVVLIAAVVRVLPTMKGSDVRLVWPVWLFGIVLAITSAIVSPAVGVSLMKDITFTLAASVVLVAVNGTPPAQLQKLQTWLITVCLTVIALSALTLAKPPLGAGLNGGLQGLLGQPQALGIFIAPFAAWSAAGVLLMRSRTSWIEVLIAVATVVLVFLTRARTAALATGLAIALVLLTRFLARRSGPQAKLGRPLLLLALVGVGVTTYAFATGKLNTVLLDFVYKDQRHGNLGDAFLDTRGGVFGQWQNFLTSPAIGHGFGVYADGSFPSGVVEVYGIPISAPIEKGFLPTAILEEGGVLGALLLLLLIAWLTMYAWRNTDLRWRAMFFACLCVNFGECVFLAPGGIGMIDWICLAVALSGYRSTVPLKTRLRRSPPPEPTREALVENWST